MSLSGRSLPLHGMDPAADLPHPGPDSADQRRGDHLLVADAARIELGSGGQPPVVTPPWASGCSRRICSPQQISEWGLPSGQGQGFS